MNTGKQRTRIAEQEQAMPSSWTLKLICGCSKYLATNNDMNIQRLQEKSLCRIVTSARGGGGWKIRDDGNILEDGA